MEAPLTPTDFYNAAVVFVLGMWGLLAWDGYRRTLLRDTKNVAELKHELAATQADWMSRFERLEHQYDQRLTVMEKRINAMTPAMNPLGSHYSTRGPT